jgi:hypothetical protein
MQCHRRWVELRKNTKYKTTQWPMNVEKDRATATHKIKQYTFREIQGFQGSDDDDDHDHDLLVFGAMWFCWWMPVFHRNIRIPSSAPKAESVSFSKTMASTNESM